jgi:serine/threonine protein kinase
VKIPCPPGTCPLLRDLLVKLLDKNPATRITIHEIRHHPWVTLDGKAPLAAGQDKVSVEVTDEERDSGVFTGVNKRGAIQRMASLKHLMHKKRVSLELRRKSSGAQSMLAIAAAASAARKASISPEMVLEGTTASVRAADEA